MALPSGWRRAALLALALWTFVGLGSRVVGSLALLLGSSVRVAPFDVGPGSDEVRKLTDSARTAGLEAGDHLLSVDDRPYLGRSSLGQALARSHGDALRLELARGEGSEALRLQLPAPIAVVRVEGAANWALAASLTVFLPAFCALLGFYVVFRRPEDALAWLLLALLLGFGSITSGDADPYQWSAPSRIATLAFKPLFSASWPLWMLLFGVYFPERSVWDRRWPWVKWLVGLPIAVIALASTILTLGDSESWRSVGAVSRLLDVVGPSASYFSIAGVSAFFPLLGHKSGTLASPDSRRRLRLLWTGAAVSLTPVLGLLVEAMIRRGQPLEGVPEWISLPALALLLVFPLTLAYVIVVRRALDVGVVIRQGLQYALARNAALALQVALSALLVFGALMLAADPTFNRPRRITFMALGVAAVIWLQAGAQRLRAFVDRRFFREALDTERMLTELGEDARSIVDAPVLLDTVTRRLADALHAPRVAAFLERDGRFELVRALGVGEDAMIALPADGPVVRRLAETERPALVYPDDPHSWVRSTPEAPALRGLHTQLLIPLHVRDRLLGVLSLGPKLSEQAYSPSDQRVLASVGAQVGLALENARLAAVVAAEVARRERLNRELEIAREVQERLFPQVLPPMAGLDYAGRCRPARGVGGDYYDFLALPDGRLGIAVGDVSGKGVSAALLMAGLQASLRGQTSFEPPRLAELMMRVNKLVCDASSANRYATFFYAQYEATSRRLDYVNAGHNAPVLLRADGTVERLDRGGPVVGLLEDACYESASAELRPGDVLIAYTDGLSEAMNAADEEWGEERLVASALACTGLSAERTLDALVGAADAFTAGVPQYDDMTVVVARILGGTR